MQQFFNCFFLSLLLCAALTKATVEVTDNNGVPVRDLVDSQQRVNAVKDFFDHYYPYRWNNYVSSECIRATDAWERVNRCNNSLGNFEIVCSRTQRAGVRYSQSTSEGGSESSSESNGFGWYRAEGGMDSTRRLAFTVDLGKSKTTYYDWSATDSTTWNKETETTVAVTVPPRSSVDIMQVVGRCGAYIVSPPIYRPVAESGASDRATEEHDDGKYRKAYFVINGQYNYDQAKAACSQVDGATLASMKNEGEYRIVKSLLGAFPDPNGHLAVIGMTRRKNGGHFYWDNDGSLASYANGFPPAAPKQEKTYWRVTEPNNDGEWCVVLRNAGSDTLRWEDWYCNELRFSALCEFVY